MPVDEWIIDGKRITDSDLLSKLRRTIEDESALILEHRFYRGARAPHRFVCDDFGVLEDYLQKSTSAGDSFYVWVFEACCRDDNAFETGKVPDSKGRVPRGGAY